MLPHVRGNANCRLAGFSQELLHVPIKCSRSVECTPIEWEPIHTLPPLYEERSSIVLLLSVL